MTRVVVDEEIFPLDRLLERMPASWDVEVGIPTDDDGLRDALAGRGVALVTSRVPLDRAVLADAADLQVVGKLGTGIDSVDVAAAEAHDITVTYTPGHNALSVAEHTLCLVLATLRRLTAARALVEDGRWRDEYEPGSRLSGSTVGIVGFGDVGKRVGTLLAGFDVDILVHDPYVPAIDAELVGGESVALDDLLAASDVVVVTAELTAETRGMIGERELESMDEDAILVNTARGPIVDEDALVDAVRSGTIGGAGLDVFEAEPLDADAPLLDLENVVVTPHVAAVTSEARAKTIDRLAENVTRLVAGDPLADRYVASSEE